MGRGSKYKPERLGFVIKGWQNLSKQGMGPPTPANDNVEYTS